MAPVTAGFVVLAVGIFVGAVRGNRSFRLGVLLLAVATVLFLGGLLLIHVPSMWPIIAGLVVGLAGLVLCVAGLRDAPAHT
jgi:hypothetical protein